MSKRVRELLNGVEFQCITGTDRTQVRGISYDSRRTTPGDIFVALTGQHVDGHSYLQAALDHGAVALVIQQGHECDYPANASTVISVANTAHALASIATHFYDQPASRLHLVGVTGTNGKSTTIQLINLIHQAAGFRTGAIGTVAYELDGERRCAPHTTPQAPELQSLLAEMRDRDVNHVVMEVSSHALDQHRADGCVFRETVFTNLTRDHLDYHQTEEAYFKTKLRLFADPSFAASTGKTNIINIDDPAGARIAASARGSVLRYGLDPTADITATDIAFSSTGTELTLVTPHDRRPARFGLVGRFNVYNALAAVGVAVAQGLSLDLICSVLETAQAPEGRFQRVPSDDCTVIVDYAHTPDGLEKVIGAARSICHGKLIVVFGCGGDRDPGKRPMMGELVSRLADVCIVTSDNPRSEEPQAIIDQILSGIPIDRRRSCILEVDRTTAINHAITSANPDDLVLLAGKGHETYQIMKDRTIHFDDREVAAAALQLKSATSGVTR